MPKQVELQKELARWAELFSETDEATRKAADGLIQKAAFLHAMCVELEEVINASGAIKVHPDNPELQKEVPAVKEYARLSESYASIVNKLNILRLKTAEDDDDELEKYQ
jgi:hypothetical protein